MKKNLVIVSLVSLIYPNFILAQEATSSATPSATIEYLPSSTPTPTPTHISEPAILPTTYNLQTTTDTSVPSAQIRKKTFIKRLTRNNFQIDEQISVKVENTYDTPVEVAVLDFDGQPVVLPTHIEKTGSDTLISILPSYQLSPGKYQLHIFAGGTTQIQDFTWGVLAINPDKSIYLPGEPAFISMAILDEKGVMVCNANVTLDITDPAGAIHTLSTQLGTIKINPECNVRDLTIKPDYEATFTKTLQEGIYQLKLDTETPNGTYSIADQFTVQSQVDFDIQRTGPTRIFPIKAYPMQAKVKFSTAFSGKIIETVPDSFTISPLPNTFQYSEITTEQLPTIDSPKLSLTLPLSGDFPITQGFGQSLTDSQLSSFYQSFGLSAHDGIDYSVPENIPVSSVDDGKVVQSGNGAYGITVVIEHTWGRSYYGHLNQNQVEVDQTIKKGDIIGLSGNTGITTGPHLHFGIRPKDYNIFNGYFGKVDPLPYLSSHILSAQSVKKIAWDVTAKAGDTVTLGYQFDAPEISPEFYLTGPLKFYVGNQTIPTTKIDPDSQNPFVMDTQTQKEEPKLVFQENRQWQIAADADIVIEASVHTVSQRLKNKKNMVFITDQIGYAFWVETTTAPRFSKTTDGGATWTDTASLGSLDANNITVWYDRWTPGDVTGNYIHIFITNNSDDELYYERIDTASSDAQLGEVAITTTGTLTTNLDGVSITKGTDGILYIAITSSQSSFSDILRCTGTCGTAGNWSSMTDNFANPTGRRDWIQMTPLLGGKILLVRQDTGTGNDDIDYDVLTGTTWAGFVDIDTDVTESSDPNLINFGVVTRLDTGYAYLTYIPNQATVNSSEVRTQVYDGSTWTAKTDCLADTEPATTDMVIFTDVAIDTETGDIYCAYTYGAANTTQNIYYKKSTDGMTTWSSQSQLNTSHTGSDLKYVQLNGVSNERIYFNYLFNSTTDTLEGATVVDLAPPPPDELMRHGMWFTKAGAKMQFSF